MILASNVLVSPADLLTLILLMWRIWWAPNNASKWQMGFNSAFNGVNCRNSNNEGWPQD